MMFSNNYIYTYSSAFISTRLSVQSKTFKAIRDGQIRALVQLLFLNMTFDPDTLPDLKGKVFIVTGGNSGM